MINGRLSPSGVRRGNERSGGTVGIVEERTWFWMSADGVRHASDPAEAPDAGPTGPASSAVALDPPRRDRRIIRSAGGGAARMAVRLHAELDDRAVVLSDRRLPGGRASVDHVVVAPSGVWLVAARKLKGVVDYRRDGGRLLVAGRDRTELTQVIGEAVAPVAGLVDDRSVPVHPALVLVEADWGSPARILTKRPYWHGDVWIVWPAALIKMIGEPGPLDDGQVAEIGRRLELALPAR